MLPTVTIVKSEMMRLTNLEDLRCRCWCAVVILFAVCALTVSVATRYGSPGGASNDTVTTVQKHSSPEPGRQRLLNNAASWIPPVVASAVRQAPASSLHIAPAVPALPSLVFDENLYNRPPPSSQFS
jgi:hypothetical protein